MKKTIKLSPKLRNKMLSEEQLSVVRDMIVNSMKDVYTDKGEMPNESFYKAANSVAEKILKNVQMALIQISVFEKAVKRSKPIKKNKKK